MLILITGLPGTGKTTVARALSEMLGARHANTDIVREKINYRQRYDSGSKRTVYLRLLSEVEELIASKHIVVVDATFYLKRLRKPFADLARRQKVPLIWIQIVADEKVIEQRLAQPRPDSDATFTVYRILKQQYEDLEVDHLTVSSDKQSIAQMVEAILAYLPGIDSEEVQVSS